MATPRPAATACLIASVLPISSVRFGSIPRAPSACPHDFARARAGLAHDQDFIFQRVSVDAALPYPRNGVADRRSGSSHRRARPGFRVPRPRPDLRPARRAPATTTAPPCGGSMSMPPSGSPTRLLRACPKVVGSSSSAVAPQPALPAEPEPAGPFPRFRAFPGERHHGNGRLRPDRALPAGNALRAQREPDQGDREIRWLVRVRDARLVADRSRSCPARSPGGGTCRSDAGLQQTARAFDTEGHHTCAENDKEERPRPRTRAPRRTTNKRSLGLSARFIRISSKPP